MYSMMEKYIQANKLGNEFSRALSNRRVLGLIGLSLNVTESKNNFIRKDKEIRVIICEKNYQKAISKFEFRYLRTHWKIFFLLAKHKCAFGVYMMALLIQRLRKN